MSLTVFPTRFASVRRVFLALLVIGFTGQPCASGESKADDPRAPEDSWEIPRGVVRDFGEPPPIPDGALSPELAAAVETAFGDLATTGWRKPQFDALRFIATARDPRVAWLVADLARIVTEPQLGALLALSATEMLGVIIEPGDHWRVMTDHLIAWDIPAPPGYLDVKRRIYLLVLPSWAPLFAPGPLDWRHVSWGGVLLDDRPFGATDQRCNCIPAADNPAVTGVSGGDWLDDGDWIFGIGINGEYRAYPRRIMEVREMVNDTLGGRHLGIPYCTLCGSAQAYLTDELPAGVTRPVLRTSGLLVRSNKIMFDINTYSVIDTFTGLAINGPLAERGVQLSQVGVVTTTWGEWKAAHPQTTVLSEGLALGRNPDFRNSRDANGPIFPVGDVDPRLPVHEDVLGVINEAGTPVAFHVASALRWLAADEPVVFEDIRLVKDGGGLRAIDADGGDLGGHQAFWFAWSQFHPSTRLWPAIEAGR